MILLDTTILVYAVGADHPLREPCRQIVSAIGDGRVAATTTVEALQEFAHVRARRRGRADARATASSFTALLGPLVQPDADDLEHGLRLFVEHESIGAFDAVLAAIVQRRDHLTGLLSADTGFATISDFAAWNPSNADALDTLLG